MVVLKFGGGLLPLWVFLLTSCWLPLVDPELSQSILVTSKMGGPVLSFSKTVSLPDFDPRSRTFYFLPENQKNPVRGFLVLELNEGLRAHYLDANTVLFAGLWEHPTGQRMRPRALPNKISALNQIWTVEWNYHFYVVDVVGGLPGQFNDLNVFVDPYDVRFGPNFPLPVLAAGVTFFSTGSDFNLRSYTLDQTYVHRQDFADWLNSVSSSGQSNYASISLPTGIPGGTAFLFLPQQGENLVVSLRTNENTFTNHLFSYHSPNFEYEKSFGFEGQIEATINNATQILVRVGSDYVVYDQDERVLTRFPAGMLHFCHERLENGQWFSVFSRVVLRSTSDSRYDLRVDVYEYPSARLADLRL